MSFPFNAHAGLIHVQAELEGPLGIVQLVLALDTAATETMIRVDRVLKAGYDLSLAVRHVRIATAGGNVNAPILVVTRIGSLGKDRFYLPITAYTVPANIGTDGVLGLDFFRNGVLNIDFQTGLLTLT